MTAVGIDVSKGKSTVTIRKPGDVVLMPPVTSLHTQTAINSLIGTIRNLGGETKVCMEHTGRYYEPVATWLSDAGIICQCRKSRPHQGLRVRFPVCPQNGQGRFQKNRPLHP